MPDPLPRLGAVSEIIPAPNTAKQIGATCPTRANKVRVARLPGSQIQLWQVHTCRQVGVSSGP